jgi:hypothetical protein
MCPSLCGARVAGKPPAWQTACVLFADYAARWTASVPAPAEWFTYSTVVEAGREFPLLGLRLPGRHTVLLTAGFHGDEKAGPLTLLDHTRQIVAYAVERGVGLHMYPCINPSGFEAHTRYNLSGERPNNDFLRYELAPGVWAGERRVGQPYLNVTPVGDGAPKETVALTRQLAASPAPPPGQLHPRRLVLRLRLRRSGGLPAAAGALGGAGSGVARQHRRLGAGAGHGGFRRSRRLHRLPRRQHHRQMPARRGALHGRHRDHHRDPRPGRRRDQPDLDPGVHRPGGRRRAGHPAGD